LTAVQIRALPDRRGNAPQTAGARGVLADWRQVVANRPFLLFAGAMIGSYVLSFQIYLALPLQAHRASPHSGNGVTTVLFAVSAGVAAAGQLRLTAWARARWSPQRAIVYGITVMGVSFTPLLFTADLPSGSGAGARAAALAALVLAAALLALGTALVYPFEMDTVVSLSGGRLVATHYGLYNTVSGLGITLGNLTTGALWDATSGQPRLIWLALSAVGGLCALSVAALARNGKLHPARIETVAAAPN
jgi:hypothetical protein